MDAGNRAVRALLLTAILIHPIWARIWLVASVPFSALPESVSGRAGLAAKALPPWLLDLTRSPLRLGCPSRDTLSLPWQSAGNVGYLGLLNDVPFVDLKIS
jgi:hypothetical protein